MRHFSQALLAKAVIQNRKNKGISQEELSEATGINRTMIGRIERQDYMPTIRQLESLIAVLDIDYDSVLEDEIAVYTPTTTTAPHRIAVAGTGYVGLSMAVLLSQYNHVVVQSKVDKINRHESPIVDKEIQEFLSTKTLDLSATTDGDSAYRDAEFVIISTPTNYDEKLNFFDTSSVESVIRQVIAEDGREIPFGRVHEDVRSACADLVLRKRHRKLRIHDREAAAVEVRGNAALCGRDLRVVR